MVFTLAFLVMLIGAVLYLILAGDPLKPMVAELARIAFFAGLLAFLLAVGGKALCCESG